MSIGRSRATLSKRVIGVATIALISATAFVAGPSAAAPDEKPTIEQVKARVDKLNHEAEVASEKYNELRVEMDGIQARLDTVSADVDRQRTLVDGLRTKVVAAAVSDYQRGGGLSDTTAFLVADDPGAFLDQLASNEMVSTQQAGLLEQLTTQEFQLTLQEGQAQAELDKIAKAKGEAAKSKQQIEEKSDEAKDLLDSLEAADRQRLLDLQAQDGGWHTTQSRDTPRPPINDVPASGRAGIAVSTALAQVGDPYVYGAAGPDAFDCSGLTMYAWAAAGVAIPHASSAQPGVGTPVSLSALMPGDLVFYYSPISHVGMYIGGGMVVHAPHPGLSVEVVAMSSMPANSAVRIG